MPAHLFEDYHWISLESFDEDLAFAIHPSYKYALSVFARPALVGQAEPSARGALRLPGF